MVHSSPQHVVVERFFETLITGEREAARGIVQESLSKGVKPSELVTELFWPTYEHIEKLYRADQLAKLSHHLATRLLRVLVDQNATRLLGEREGASELPGRGKNVLALCGPRDSDELGAQMAVDLLDLAGYNVRFGGGGVANDEVLAHVNEHQPQVLLLFASGANDLPNIRALIDTVREVGACEGMKIAVGGGVFNRAEGLAEEIGAHVWATSPLELAAKLTGRARAEEPAPTINRRKRAGGTGGSKREAA